MPIPVKVAYGMLRGSVSHETRKRVALAAPDALTPPLLNQAIGWYDSNSGLFVESSSPTTPVKKGGFAAQFTSANDESLSVADNAAVSLGTGVDATLAGWVKLDTLGNYYFAGKYGSGTEEYLLYYSNSNSVFRLFAHNGSTATDVLGTNGGAAGIGVWYFVVAEIDATNGKLRIRVNNKTLDEGNHTSGARDSTSAFRLGRSDAGSPLNGSMARWGLWKRILTADEQTFLYNNGLGRAYTELPHSIKQNLAAFWNLDEPEGTRYDSYGANNLTDNNTVTRTVGPFTREMAAQFTLANSESLTISNNSTIQLGDTSYTLSLWVYLDTTAASVGLMSKAWNGDNLEYEVIMEQGTPNRFRFDTADASYVASSLYWTTTNPVTGTWYHILCDYDVTTHTKSISVNGGTPLTQTVTSSRTGTNGLSLGRRSDGSLYLNGRLNNIGMWKRLLTTDEKTFLYNAGRGHQYSELSSDLKTSLVAYWNLDEVSGTRYDSGGANNLTDNNTVTQAAGPGDYACGVGTWKDASKNGNHLVQTTAAARPVSDSNGVSFDGTDDYLSKTSLATPSAITDFAVHRCRKNVSDSPVVSRTNGPSSYGMSQHTAAPTGYIYAYAATGTEYVRSDSAPDRSVFYIADRQLTGGATQNDMNLWLNGVVGATKSGTPSGTIGNSIYIGASGSFTAGESKAALFVNSALSASHRRRLERLLSRMYGITLAG